MTDTSREDVYAFRGAHLEREDVYAFRGAHLERNAPDIYGNENVFEQRVQKEMDLLFSLLIHFDLKSCGFGMN